MTEDNLKHETATDTNTVLADSFLPDEETKCCICGRKESEDTKSDFLRECFEMNQDGKWDKGLMQPRLNFIEMAYIKQGVDAGIDKQKIVGRKGQKISANGYWVYSRCRIQRETVTI